MRSTVLATALGLLSLTVLAAPAIAAPPGTESPKGDTDVWGTSGWPQGAAEGGLWVDHGSSTDRIWGIPGAFNYISFRRTLLNGPNPCANPDPDSANEGGGGNPVACDVGTWSPQHEYEVPPFETTHVTTEDGTIIGEMFSGIGGSSYPIWKVTAPATKYTGDYYASYLDVYDDDGDGNTTERMYRKAGAMVIKPLRPQPDPSGPFENIDITAIVDASTSMIQNDPDFKRKDALDLLFRTSRIGDRINVVRFHNTAETILPMTELTSKAQTASLSADVRDKVENIGGTNYMGAFDKGFTDMYQDAVDKSSLNNRRKLVIFLTDGKQEHWGNRRWANYDNTHIRFTHSPGKFSWPVCSVQLGTSFSSRDVNRLKRIAASTGGKYFKAGDDSLLVDAFDGCRGVTTCQFTEERRVWNNVPSGETRSVTTNLNQGQRLATFRATGADIRPNVVLVAPSGTRYTATNTIPGIVYRTGRSWTSFEVQNPRGGAWKMEVTAHGVADDNGNLGPDSLTARATVDRCGNTPTNNNFND